MQENGLGKNGAQQAPMQLWLADLVCPVAGPPIRRGAVLTQAGRVVAVGEERFVRPPHRVAFERDFERAILIPGMVNAHIHLELSGLSMDPAPMADWIVRLVKETRQWPPHLFLASARMGAEACLAAGVTCVGDISTSGAGATAIADAGLRGIVFHEVLGLDSERAEEILEGRLREVDAMPPYVGKLPHAVRHGFSPHAPYTASPALYRAVQKKARERGWLLATHIAESPEEVEFVRSGEGAFVDVHRALGSPVEKFVPSGLSPVAYLDSIGCLESIALAVHANQTGTEDWERLRRAGVAVCLCPTTAAFFGHRMADVVGMRQAGLRLCVGTDSRASSPSLDLREVCTALRKNYPDFEAAELLRLATVEGARALGYGSEGVGVLAPASPADFAVVVPPPGREVELDLDVMFAPDAVVRCTVTGGEIRFGG